MLSEYQSIMLLQSVRCIHHVGSNNGAAANEDLVEDFEHVSKVL